MLIKHLANEHLSNEHLTRKKIGNRTKPPRGLQEKKLCRKFHFRQSQNQLEFEFRHEKTSYNIYRYDFSNRLGLKSCGSRSYGFADVRKIMNSGILSSR